MLSITVPPKELWNSKTERFITLKEQTLQLEHSLVSISKWESKYRKPFLSNNKTSEEILDYIKFMTITQNVNPDVYTRLTAEHIKQISNYIDEPMTATTFSQEENKQRNKEIVTSELIYYWMIALQIPFECQKWHLNRLLTLIRICNIKNAPPKKRSKREILSRNAALNAARRQKLNSKG